MLKFSVVMPVYAKDRPEWFEQALDSVLNQTLTCDDIIIVVDGPLNAELDSSLGKYQSSKNISIVKLDVNQGLSNALNVGIANAKYDLIARMDSDDIAVQNRFELQVAEFIKNKELGILGGQIAEFIDNPDKIVSLRKVPVEHDDIKTFSKQRSPFNHPTVMYKKVVIQSLGGYDTTAVRIEDYDLWLRALDANIVCRNIDYVLLKYRSTIDSTKRRKTLASLKGHSVARISFYRKGYISLYDLVFGISTQMIIFILPSKIVGSMIKRTVRSVK